MTPEAARFYFNQGFIPDSDCAVSDLRDLISWVDKLGSCVRNICFFDLLCNIISKSDTDSLSIPITAGYDSLCLLASAESVKYKPTQCYTWGVPNSPDVIGAKRAVGEHPHTILDTRYIQWNFTDLVKYTNSREYVNLDGMPRIDAIQLFRHLSALMPVGAVGFSGYLGDMLSGAHLARQDSVANPTLAIAKMNSTGIGDNSFSVEYYVSFERKAEELIEEVLSKTQFTRFDIFDYLFRQRQRIRAAMVPHHSSWMAPFEDEKMIVKWALTPLEQRKNQKLYKDILCMQISSDRLPEEKSSNKDVVTLKRGMKWIARKVLPPQKKIPKQMEERANPIDNESVHSTMHYAFERLRARRILDVPVLPNLDRLIIRPTQRDWNLCMLALTLEVFESCRDDGADFRNTL